jgi:CPA2 family monovalent cation:H+ antiporter-2
MDSLLLTAALYLGAAVVLVPLAARAGLGSVIGYLGAGLLIGPVLGLAGAERASLQGVSEIGVVMMLFLIGLELAPRALWQMRHALVGMGAAQVAGTAAAVTLVLALGGGMAWPVAATLGLTFALSSTAIVMQTLSEKRLTRTPGGQGAFAVLLAQDIAVIPILAALPLLAAAMGVVEPAGDAAAAHGPHAAAETGGAASTLRALVDRLPAPLHAALTLGIVAAIAAAGHFLARPAFRFVHASRLTEMGTFVALFLIIAIAYLMHLVGLSPALGAFIAGVVLAGSEFRHEIEADIRPFKGLLLGLFFMTVGIGIDTATLTGAPLTILALTLGLIALKAGVLAAVGWAGGLRGRDRGLFAFALAQGGEFGFVLIGAAGAILPPQMAQTALVVLSLSMLATPALFAAARGVERLLAQPETAPEHDQIDAPARVIIAGIGRFGQVVNRLVRNAGAETVVLDSDLGTIEVMRKFGVQGFFGDPTRPELLDAAGLPEARVLVVAVDDRAAALTIVQHARKVRPDLHIVARARDRTHVYELFQAGADDIVREMFDSSIRAGRYVLENIGFSEAEAARMSQTFFRIDRAAMRDLAALWVPGQAVHLNAAYVQRARQLDRDLETALIAERDAPAAGEAAE